MNIESLDGEVWKEMHDHPGYYVSSFGRVFGKRKAIVSGHKDRDGYLRLECYNGLGKKKSIFIHRAVASAFCENPLGKSQVNHIDGNKQNNNASNLEWCTGEENRIHATTVLKSINMVSIKVTCVDTGISYRSATNASKSLSGTPCRSYHILRACRNPSRTAFGMHWKFTEDYGASFGEPAATGASSNLACPTSARARGQNPQR